LKIWQKYNKFLQTGQWHIHTSFTDGKDTVNEYCDIAQKKGIPLVAFTEHVRKSLNYDFNDFLSQIDQAQEKYEIIILSGCETKVLPNGDLDVEKSVIAQVDYPIFAFHTFPKDISIYIKCLKKVIKIPNINTWAHPGHFLLKNNLKLDIMDLKEILELIKKYDVLIEINDRYKVPSNEWMKEIRNLKISTVRGDNIHSKSNL
jgi:DNA polymerase (family 10)/putative hydrolase